MESTKLQPLLHDSMKLLKRGAEADIYMTCWDDAKAVLKIRKAKKYRNPLLDQRLCSMRTARESQTLSYAKSLGIRTPLVYFVNLGNYSIIMQKIPGTPVHDLPDSNIITLSREMGRMVGVMHKNGLMHGDLTTSNFIYHYELYVLDFGLSQRTVKPEDHAVDLRLIKEILNSAHARIMEPSWRRFIAGYRSAVGAAYCTRITGLVRAIEGRGRYAKVV